MADNEGSISSQHSLGRSGDASTSDILSALKDQVVALNSQVMGYSRQFPSNTSGQITASTAGTLVQSGFVRLTGISVVASVTAALGNLYDAPTAVAATAGAKVGVILTTPGFYAVNMVFANGLVAQPSAGQVVSLHYTRV